ncbi:MAG TPA: carboxylesterase family protein [Tepidiformaceae bacterium]|nr:carboxylesterase family protein [Tepidiformaceae bacterium]
MPTVHTSYGLLKGAETAGVESFKGIPFAQPPVGELRWAPPRKPAPWTGTREALDYGPAAPQAQSPVSGLMGLTLTNTSEDCLSLNVWTPAADGGKRPVMVFIHGGAFVIGAGSQQLYDGSHLARRGDVVVVTINYRLGALGFLRLLEPTGGGLAAGGNEAILDQVAALEWVRDEIGAFGGDPGNVTVFGESAGAISISALLASSRAKGLFGRAILQSGSANLLTAPESAAKVGAQIVADLAVGTSAGALRAVSTARVMEAQERATPRSGGVSYAPVADGETIAREPFAAVAEGSAAGIELLVGTNLDEMNLFGFMDPSISALDEDALIGRIAGSMHVSEERAREVAAAYDDAVAARGDQPTPTRTWLAFQTDQVFRAPAMRLAEAQASHTPSVYAYRFDYRSTQLQGVLGAGHALELPFVFGTLADPGFGAVAGGDTPVTRGISDAMQDAWIAFARTGNPAAETLPAWPRYETGARATMLFNAELRVADAPEEATRALW